jgi:hypothetical protein
MLYVLTEYVTDIVTDMLTQIFIRNIPERTQDSSASKNPVTNVHPITCREGTEGRSGT